MYLIFYSYLYFYNSTISAQFAHHKKWKELRDQDYKTFQMEKKFQGGNIVQSREYRSLFLGFKGGYL